jgi:hypothetical protein
MARSYGRFTTDIWRDQKFRALDRDSQWAYFMLGTQPDISAAGMLPLTIRRWSKYASDGASDALSDALFRLAEKRFLVIDEDTEELLVRSFAKWDGGINNDKRRPVVLEAAAAVVSPVLRGVLAVELRDLGVEDALCDALCDVASDEPSDTTSASDRVVVSTSSSPSQPSTLNPQPATRVPAAPAPSRAARLPDGWKPNVADIEWARVNGLADDFARYETEKFIDYWRAKAGREATKTDWSATWRNWLRKANEQTGGRTPTGALLGGATAKARGWLDLAGPEHPELEGRTG